VFKDAKVLRVLKDVKVFKAPQVSREDKELLAHKVYKEGKVSKVFAVNKVLRVRKVQETKVYRVSRVFKEVLAPKELRVLENRVFKDRPEPHKVFKVFKVTLELVADQHYLSVKKARYYIIHRAAQTTPNLTIFLT
jgi:hypothetical protein